MQLHVVINNHINLKTMKKIILIIDFRKYSNVALLEKARLIRRNLSPVPTGVLTGPQVPFLDDLDTIMEEFRLAIDENIPSTSGTRAHVLVLREALIEMLKKIKSYLDVYYGDDAVAMSSSGFDIAKEREPAKEHEITGFKVQPLSIGVVRLLVDAIPNAKIYFFEYRQENDTNWQTVEQSSSRCTLTHLESGKRYFFRVGYALQKRSHFVSHELTSIVL